MYVPAGQPIGSSHLPARRAYPVLTCSCESVRSGTWTPSESTLQQICRHSAARVARGLSWTHIWNRITSNHTLWWNQLYSLHTLLVPTHHQPPGPANPLLSPAPPPPLLCTTAQLYNWFDTILNNDFNDSWPKCCRDRLVFPAAQVVFAGLLQQHQSDR